MNSDDIDRFLCQSLADRKLSGGEKTALADWLAKHVVNDQQRGLARHTAFEAARAAVSDRAATEVIGWLEDVMKVLVPNATPEATEPADNAAFFAPGEKCLQQIIHRFHTCRTSANLCVFTITDDRISRAILDAHHRRVKVRVISDAEKAHDLGSDVEQFRAAGIEVKLVAVGGPPDSGLTGHMHHKFAIFDGVRLLNGSYNWTRGAANVNYENIVDSGDVKLISTFTAEFARLWNAF